MYILFAFLIIWLIWALLSKSLNDKPSDFNKENTLPLRGLMAILIVIYHGSRNIMIANAGPAIVGAFFFISGYGLISSLSSINGGGI